VAAEDLFSTGVGLADDDTIRIGEPIRVDEPWYPSEPAALFEPAPLHEPAALFEPAHVHEPTHVREPTHVTGPGPGPGPGPGDTVHLRESGRIGDIGAAVAPVGPRRSIATTIKESSTQRRLVTAAVVVALLGGGLWLEVGQPRTHVDSTAAPLPTAPPPELPIQLPPPILPSIAAPAPTTTSPPAPPTGPVSLAGWKLTIPEASQKGTAANINPAKSSSPWLTRGSNGSLKFWAPVNGATTPNSEHPRTELDSLNNFKAGSGQHALRASLSVAQAPTGNQDIIIGQIHGADDISSVPFVMLHYDSGTIKVVMKQAQSGSTSDKFPLITGVPLGSRFDFTISDPGTGSLVFTATYGSNTKRVTTAIPGPFKGATVRFQAGAYQQGEGGDGSSSDGARVTFYTLSEGPRASP
jgi:Alginate lyase